MDESLTGLAAYWMRLRRHATEVARVRQKVEDLRSLTQAQMAELQERHVFADRLLARQAQVRPVELERKVNPLQ